MAIEKPGRLMELLGLPEATATVGTNEKRVRAPDRRPLFGLMHEWTELPAELIRNRWLRVTRSRCKGLLSSFEWRIALNAVSGGSELRHDLSLKASGPFSALIVRLFFVPAIDRHLIGAQTALADWARGHADHPFPNSRQPPKSVSDDLSNKAMRADGSEYGHGQVSRLVRWLLAAPTVDLVALRPLDLASHWDLRIDEVTEILLVAHRVGILDKAWLMGCSTCSATVIKTPGVATIGEKKCPECGNSVAPDFGRNVELVFDIAGGITRDAATQPGRDHDLGRRCAVRLNVGPRKRVTAEWHTDMSVARLRILETGATEALTLNEASDKTSLSIIDGKIRTAGVGGLGRDKLEIVNRDGEHRTLEIVDDSGAHSYPAKRALLLQAHRDISKLDMPGEEQAIRLDDVAILATDLGGLAQKYQRAGDPKLFKAAQELLQAITDAVRECGGSVQSRVGETLVAAMPDAAAAINAVTLLKRSAQVEDRLALVAAVDCGSIDLFRHGKRSAVRGTPVTRALRLVKALERGYLGLTDDAAAQPSAIKLLQKWAMEHVTVGGLGAHTAALASTKDDHTNGDQSASAA